MRERARRGGTLPRRASRGDPSRRAHGDSRVLSTSSSATIRAPWIRNARARACCDPPRSRCGQFPCRLSRKLPAEGGAPSTRKGSRPPRLRGVRELFLFFLFFFPRRNPRRCCNFRGAGRARDRSSGGWILTHGGSRRRLSPFNRPSFPLATCARARKRSPKDSLEVPSESSDGMHVTPKELSSGLTTETGNARKSRDLCSRFN